MSDWTKDEEFTDWVRGNVHYTMTNKHWEGVKSAGVPGSEASVKSRVFYNVCVQMYKAWRAAIEHGGIARRPTITVDLPGGRIRAEDIRAVKKFERQKERQFEIIVVSKHLSDVMVFTNKEFRDGEYNRINSLWEKSNEVRKSQ